MGKYLRCKACGYIIEESKLGALCPACGVKKEMFIPDPERLSDKRRKILDSHIHAIIVHFPQAFPIVLFLAITVALFVHNDLRNDLLGTVKVLSLSLPFVVIGAFLSGIFDAKVRFRKITTPLLKGKILLGVAFFISSVAGAVISQTAIFTYNKGLLLVMAFQFCAIICSALLGKMGASMVNSKFQG